MLRLFPSDRLLVAVGDLTPDGESEAGLAADEEAWTSAPTASEPVEGSAAAALEAFKQAPRTAAMVGVPNACRALRWERWEAQVGNSAHWEKKVWGIQPGQFAFAGFCVILYYVWSGGSRCQASSF
jgi:hypothetical protein